MTNIIVATKRNGIIDTSVPVTIKNNPVISSGISRLDKLTDVVANNESNGATLVYDASTDKYIVQKLDISNVIGDIALGTQTSGNYVATVAAGNGMVVAGSGSETAAVTVSILANTGIVSNTTGLYVNTAYIGILTANNSTFAFGKSEGDLNVNSAIYANSSVTNTFTVGTAAYFVANGNLGIGTTTPTNKLSVNGDVFVGNSTVNTSISPTTISLINIALVGF